MIIGLFCVYTIPFSLAFLGQEQPV